VEGNKMASSLSFNQQVQTLIPVEVMQRLSIIPIDLREDKLCLVARRPLSDQALLELKLITGVEDYELQLVGEDVIDAYLSCFIDGSLFSTAA
jgi:type II secretory ATPase GspE/PulE/Tfp pilus assembly ATPase PilB-like protein